MTLSVRLNLIQIRPVKICQEVFSQIIFFWWKLLSKLYFCEATLIQFNKSSCLFYFTHLSDLSKFSEKVFSFVFYLVQLMMILAVNLNLIQIWIWPNSLRRVFHIIFWGKKYWLDWFFLQSNSYLLGLLKFIIFIYFYCLVTSCL